MKVVDKINNKLPDGWELKTIWFWAIIASWVLTVLMLITGTVMAFERNIYTEVFVRHAMVLWVVTPSFGVLLSVTVIFYRNLLEHEKND